MQIRLKQQLRQVASNTLGDLEPDEVDDYLNQAHPLFLDKILDPRNNKLQVGFEQSYQRFVEAGIQPTRTVRTLRRLTNDSMYAALPSFLHTLVLLNVSTEKCQAAYKQVTHKYAVIPFNMPHNVPDFSQFSIAVGTDTFSVPEEYLNPENVEHAIRYLHEKTVGSATIYWESVDAEFHPNSFIAKVAQSNTAQSAVITYTAGNSQTINFTTSSYNVADLDTDGIYRGCNIAQQEDVADMLKDPWQTTKHDRPLVEIRGKHVIVYHNEKFVPKLLEIGYIPIPKPVSYNLNISSDMPERTHQAIVALAAELIQQDMLGIEKQPESRT